MSEAADYCVGYGLWWQSVVGAAEADDGSDIGGAGV